MNNPICSHCGTEFDDDQTWHGSDVETGDCDISELKCENLDCLKIFYVICVHEVTFKKCDEDGDDIY